MGAAPTLRLGAEGWGKVKGTVLAAQRGPRPSAEDLPFSSPVAVLKFRVLLCPGCGEKSGDTVGGST